MTRPVVPVEFSCLIRLFLFLRGSPGHPPSGSCGSAGRGGDASPSIGFCFLTSLPSFEGESLPALLVEGATRAPLIAKEVFHGGHKMGSIPGITHAAGKA
jgi:hypothetical protein